ncbi:hypothetical protein LCGC14_0485010 [marine sediment metagenome]|uniref:Uncharacterized protein n=1 Tax=marine sediment metagenome TaxID=412755 RepID=A0A0F9VH25_9ZZZZ
MISNKNKKPINALMMNLGIVLLIWTTYAYITTANHLHIIPILLSILTINLAGSMWYTTGHLDETDNIIKAIETK